VKENYCLDVISGHTKAEVIRRLAVSERKPKISKTKPRLPNCSNQLSTRSEVLKTSMVEMGNV
jgi:hypothetical protein